MPAGDAGRRWVIASSDGFGFGAPDRRRIWKNLALTMSQAAGLTGVSERQIQHWMDKSYIDHDKDGGRKVSGETLDRILLIKQARDAGVPLRQAVPMAQAYLQSEMMGDLQSEMAHSVLRELQERLRVASASIAALDEILGEVVSPDGKLPAPRLPASGGDRVSSRRSG